MLRQVRERRMAIQATRGRTGYGSRNRPTTQGYHRGGRFTRRIGNTNYRVGVHFSETSSETMEEKILRMMKNEIATEGAM